MRNGKWFIGLFTAMLLLVAVVFGTNEYAWDGTIGITAQISVSGHTEQIRCWKKNREDCYLFLPAYADLSQLQLNTNVSNPVYLDGQRISRELDLSTLQTNIAYDLCYLSRGKEHHYTLTFLSSENLPALYIDTASGTMEDIHALQENQERGSLRLYSADGQLEHRGNLEVIKGRGNSTWEFEKKPYNLTLSTPADLLGMGEASRWILLANATDDSHLKNKIAYDLAQDAGLAYSPSCQWVELYLNGEYTGLYLLSERNEVHPQRVNISQEGSFLVGKDWEWRFEKNGDPYVKTQYNTALRLYYSDLPQEQVLDLFQSLENALMSWDGYDDVTGRHWQELIDLDSWAGKYLVEEILGNEDAGTLSQYYYLDGSDASGKICAGPVWDMDLSLSFSTEDWLRSKDQLYGSRPHVYGSYWMHALFEQEDFHTRVAQLYAETYLPLLNRLLESRLEEYGAYIHPAAQRDQLRWQTRNPEEARQEVARFLEARIAFLNRIWVEQQDYVTVTVIDCTDDLNTFVIPAGSCVTELPDYAGHENIRFDSWYHLMSGEPFDITQPVWEDIVLAAHYETIS